MRSPIWKFSRGIDWSRRMMPSPRPRSTMTLPYSTRLTTPLTISPTRSLNSSYWRSRSASRTLWVTTWRAIWVCTRPNSKGGRIALQGGGQGDLGVFVFHRIGLDHGHAAFQRQFAGARVDQGADVVLGAVAALGRLGDRLLAGGDHDLFLDRFLAGDRVGDLQQFEAVGGNAGGHGVYSSSSS